MKASLKGLYKKTRHKIRMFIESYDFINDKRIQRKQREFLKDFSDVEVKNNKILFSNYMGRGYGCNCKYLANKIIELGLDYEMVWIVNSDENKDEFPSCIRLIPYGSRDALYELSSAKYIITNYHLNYFIKKGFVKKRSQFYIQMWHGSYGIKKIEKHAVAKIESNMWLKVAKENSHITDFWISNSKFETNIYKTAFWDVENIVELGHPRNDIFFQCLDIKKKIYSKYGVDSDKKMVLYMPTFREDYRLDCYDIHIDKLCETLSNKFGGDWIFFIRLHPRISKYRDSILKGNRVIDATTYNDVQELIAAADVMISDYSSCIFDYLHTKRPAFVYATDIDEYNTERGFYYSLYETPFMIAKNNNQLMESVEKFDIDKYLEKIKTFLAEKGTVEDGKASERIIKFLQDLNK